MNSNFTELNQHHTRYARQSTINPTNAVSHASLLAALRLAFSRSGARSSSIAARRFCAAMCCRALIRDRCTRCEIWWVTYAGMETIVLAGGRPQALSLWGGTFWREPEDCPPSSKERLSAVSWGRGRRGEARKGGSRVILGCGLLPR